MNNTSTLKGKVNGSVTVTCTFDDTISSWYDYTIGASVIRGVCLEGAHNWKKCDVTVQADTGTNTFCMITLLKNGELYGSLPKEINTSGEQKYTFPFDINDTASLVVAGYISNHGHGAGARVTLTGYC
jgi:hypothetical protein